MRQQNAGLYACHTFPGYCIYVSFVLFIFFTLLSLQLSIYAVVSRIFHSRIFSAPDTAGYQTMSVNY